jgi:hypothetical protein
LMRRYRQQAGSYRCQRLMSRNFASARDILMGCYA